MKAKSLTSGDFQVAIGNLDSERAGQKRLLGIGKLWNGPSIQSICPKTWGVFINSIKMELLWLFDRMSEFRC